MGSLVDIHRRTTVNSLDQRLRKCMLISDSLNTEHINIVVTIRIVHQSIRCTAIAIAILTIHQVTHWSIFRLIDTKRRFRCFRIIYQVIRVTICTTQSHKLMVSTIEETYHRGCSLIALIESVWRNVYQIFRTCHFTVWWITIILTRVQRTKEHRLICQYTSPRSCQHDIIRSIRMRYNVLHLKWFLDRSYSRPYTVIEVIVAEWNLGIWWRISQTIGIVSSNSPQSFKILPICTRKQ